jgi:hypothetical protein
VWKPASPFGWERYVGPGGATIAVDRFGASAPGPGVMAHYGFTPTSGLVMSTRTGDLDPGAGYYLARSERMTAARFQRMVSHESGLLGVSGTQNHGATVTHGWRPESGFLNYWWQGLRRGAAARNRLPALHRCIHQAKLTEFNSYGFKASFNPSHPGNPGNPYGWWVSPWHYGLNQGLIILMIEN